MKTKVTVDMIMSWNPCERYDREKVDRLFKSVCGRSKIMSLENALRLDVPAEDIYWLVFRNEFMTDLAMYNTAIFCWEKIARPIWEKYYPKDKRPHEAVRIKKLWLKKKATDEEMAAARASAWAAAMASARAAARDAAWDAARDAARASAWAAEGDAANKKILSHISKYAETKKTR